MTYKYIKVLCFFIFAVITPSNLFGQEEKAITFNAKVTGEFSYNFIGGLRKGYDYIGMEDFTINFSTEKLGLWKNGNFLIHGLNTHGIGPSQKLTGDLQVLSNIEAGDFTALYEIYYSQEISKLTVVLGQMEINKEFIGVKYGEAFLNSSFCIAPTISLNMPVSVFPIAAPCIFAKYEALNDLYIKAAVYDGVPGDMNSNQFDVNWKIHKEEGFLYISEVQYNYVQHYQNDIYTSKGIKTGTYRFGTIYHSGSFTDYIDTTHQKQGNWTLYFMADQMIIPKPESPNEGLAGFLQVGFAPGNVNSINNYLGCGVRYYGLMNKRPKDFIGIAVARARLNDQYQKLTPLGLSNEKAIELTYKFQFGEKASIQPDLQFLINPGATKQRNNALIALLRFELNY